MYGLLLCTFHHCGDLVVLLPCVLYFRWCKNWIWYLESYDIHCFHKILLVTSSSLYFGLSVPNIVIKVTKGWGLVRFSVYPLHLFPLIFLIGGTFGSTGYICGYMLSSYGYMVDTLVCLIPGVLLFCCACTGITGGSSLIFYICCFWCSVSFFCVPFLEILTSWWISDVWIVSNATITAFGT